ncbi:ArsR/SmtB family transcription factor [Arthrobacter cryoconiti]|uniref:ArsR/SmtB family transcription factor n=1 Tax=Arthrobacter cryoconiti TaxID=748907 RepID=A0ABV8R2N4_9MICC|nr:metalloregulator ArsR/SmtB family transcription factor [Arthrobacter cryoconiti]MCC9068073.1 metalloregulator ArsR/SmtB family transcription factor [Arthrobacter cryoconiti]
MVVEELFSVIAERTRRDILEALASEHKAVGQLVDELGVSQPTVSKHLRVLREAGVVTMQAQGQKRFYSINTTPLVLVSEWLEGLGAGVGASTRGGADVTNSVSRPENTKATGAATSLKAPASTALDPVAATQAVVVRQSGDAQSAAEATAHDGSVQAQFTRSVGRAANRAADILSNLPTFRRRKD